MTVQQLYDQTVKPLPAAERLRLAQLILNDIPPQSVVDEADWWSDQDLRDFTQAGWRRIEQTLLGNEPHG